MKAKKISRAVLRALAATILLALLFSPPVLQSSYAQTTNPADTSAAAAPAAAEP